MDIPDPLATLRTHDTERSQSKHNTRQHRKLNTGKQHEPHQNIVNTDSREGQEHKGKTPAMSLIHCQY